MTIGNNVPQPALNWMKLLTGPFFFSEVLDVYVQRANYNFEILNIVYSKQFHFP